EDSLVLDSAPAGAVSANRMDAATEAKRKPSRKTDAKVAIAAFWLGRAPSISALGRRAGLAKATAHHGFERLREGGVLVADGGGYRLADFTREILSEWAPVQQGGYIRRNGTGPVLLDIRAEDWALAENAAPTEDSVEAA